MLTKQDIENKRKEMFEFTEIAANKNIRHIITC